MTCDFVQDALLDGDRSAAVLAHATACSECRELAADVRSFEALVAAARSDSPARPPIVVPVARSAPAYWKGALAIAALTVVAVATWLAALRPSPPSGHSPSRPVHVAAAATPATTSPAAAPLAPAPPPATASVPTPATATPRSRGTRDTEAAPATAIAIPVTAAPTTATPASVSAAELRSIVLDRTSRMQDCYEHALGLDPTLGTVRTTLTVAISPEGTVAAIDTSPLPPNMVRRCIGEAIRPLTFPPSEEGLEVSVPLRFEMRAAP